MSTATGVGGDNAPGPSSSAPEFYLSATAINRFTRCENSWLLKETETEHERLAKSDALRLGTLMHRLVGAWLSGRSWVTEWQEALNEEPGWEPGFEAPEIFDRATWIMQRYVEHHGEQPEHPVIALELPFDLAVPGVPGVRVRGYLDGIVNRGPSGRKPEPWLWEIKTMGRWGRENQVAWDPQLGLYLWAASQLFTIHGAVFDALNTYRYKPKDGKDQPADRSFKRIELPFDERMVARTLDDVKRVARRAKAVLKNPGLAVRSVGEACTYCEHRKRCLTPWEE